MVIKKPTISWRRLPDLSKTTAVSLLTIAFVFLLILVIARQFNILVIDLVLIAVAGLIMTGIRWAPAVGSLLSALMLSVFLFSSSYPVYHLEHPKDPFGSNLPTGLVVLAFALFVAMVTMILGMIIGFGSGIAATIENYRSPGTLRPRWFGPTLNILIGVWLGAVLIGALSQPGVAAAATTTNGEPTVHLGISSFSPKSITITRGQTLLIVDDGSFMHNLSNGTWLNNRPQPGAEAGAPIISNKAMNGAGKSVEVGPFATPGVYHIYCTIHAGMVLTITVQ